MRTRAQAFLAFFAETITQILLAAVTLTVPFSDQIVITTAPRHGLYPFTGKCSITSYTTDQGTVRDTYGCSLFLPEMTAIADSLGQVPPVMMSHINISRLNQNIINAFIVLIIATILPIFSEKSPKLHDLAVYVAALAGTLAIVALAHAESLTRSLTRNNQNAAVGDGIYVLVATALMNLYCLKK